MKPEQKLKMFLVDDDEMFVQSLRHCMHDKDTEIKIFPSGEECLKSMREDPEIVVVDYCLSESSPNALNGLQILNEIKHSNPHTEVIMLSSQDNLNIALQAMKQGAYDYIPKGESAFIKLKNVVQHISDNRDKEDDFDNKMKKVKIVNLVIILVILLVYILNRMI